jgi:hypothetical protein
MNCWDTGALLVVYAFEIFLGGCALVGVGLVAVELIRWVRWRLGKR